MVERKYPMAKPPGFTPAIQRYSARFGADEHVGLITVQIIGAQAPSADAPALVDFPGAVEAMAAGGDGPARLDHARYVDEAGYTNHLVFAYWEEPDRCARWWSSGPVSSWWADDARCVGSTGYFVESIPARTDALETIAFAEYIRGLSACPTSRVEPMGESGYWGAARDRIPRSGQERFDAPDESPLRPEPVESRGRRLRVRVPVNHCVIRSGVSWADCGEEQLASYRSNVAPKLDEGMEFLRSNPIESGCWSLRQVGVVSSDGVPAKESWVAGHFVSLAHLERWAHTHPTPPGDLRSGPEGAGQVLGPARIADLPRGLRRRATNRFRVCQLPPRHGRTRVAPGRLDRLTGRDIFQI